MALAHIKHHFLYLDKKGSECADRVRGGVKPGHGGAHVEPRQWGTYAALCATRCQSLQKNL